MSSVNPYAPPGAMVGDVRDTQQYQEPKFWSASGRIGRLRYLAYTTGGYLVYLAALMVIGIVAALSGQPMLIGGAAILLLIPYIVFTWLTLIQRTHDMGWSGWASLAVLIPLAALIWVFKGGTEGENDYGAPPPPNTTGVKILAFGIPVFVGMIGILAAISIPAYQQYTMRAKAAAEAQRHAVPPAPQPGQQQ